MVRADPQPRLETRRVILRIDDIEHGSAHSLEKSLQVKQRTEDAQLLQTSQSTGWRPHFLVSAYFFGYYGDLHERNAMSQQLQIHPVTPQPRLIRQVVEQVQAGGVIIYPTDSTYALGCAVGNKEGMDRIRAIRNLDDEHYLTLVCRDLTELSTYAKVDNWAFRLVKNLTPGPYTFLLKASREVPRRLQHPKRKTIGMRVPDGPIARAILDELGEPLVSSTLLLPGDERPLSEPDEIAERLGKQVDLLVAGGACGPEMTTVLDCVEDEPVIVRRGKGAVDFLD